MKDRSFTAVAVGKLALSIGLNATLFTIVSGMLIGTRPHDPATFVATSLTLVAVVLAAAVIPARRAARIDPAIALRYE